MPWRDADEPGAWQELTKHEYDAAWDVVYERFAFRPGMRPETWPAFDEPAGSITWNVESEFTSASSDADYLRAERRVASELRDALVGSMGDDEFVFALDWQHPGFKFEPSRAAAPSSINSWLVPALPNGDYYLFVANDFRFGWLSHPWELSVCVFGDLVAPLRGAAERFGWPVLRARTAQ